VTDPTTDPTPAEPAAVEPDLKDWTWTLRRTCPECGFTASEVSGPEVAGRLRALTEPWAAVLARPDATRRPSPTTWSPLEYGCHVRDVCRVFTERVDAMLGEDGVAFPNWDQDATAVQERYHAQDPSVVAGELAEAAADAQAAFAAVEDGQWSLTGVRSDGSVFTVESLGQYFLHDLAHHLVDVRA
jgi:hypothetical protein